MVIVSIILGVLMILSGIYCLCTPVITFLSAGYILGILFLVFGIMGLIRGISTKRASALGIVTYILALVVGIVAVLRPGSTIAIDRILIYLLAFWFLVEGIGSIAVSVSRKAEVKGWYWGLIAGILGTIAGIFFLFHPLLTALAAGVMIGICFLQAGIQMIATSAFYKE